MTISALLAAFSMQAAPLPVDESPQAPVAVQTPSPPPQRTSEEMFQLAARNLFDLIANPNPIYEPFVFFTNKTRVWIVRTRGGGLADARVAEASDARQFLTGIFGPKTDVSFVFSPPKVVMDGAFARATIDLKVLESGKIIDCGVAYVDGVLAPPGDWAKIEAQGMWQFTQITISYGKHGFAKGRKCAA